MEDIFHYFKTLYENEKKKQDKIEKEILTFAKNKNIPYLSEEKARFLSILIKVKNPLKCFEIGLGSGYSTYVILNSISSRSKLISIDYNFFRVEDFFNNVFKKLPLSLKKKITVYPLEAFYTINKFIETGKKFDFIFLDAVKREYFEYVKVLPQLLHKTGILLIDNISYSKQTYKTITKRSKEYILGIELLNRANKYLLNNKDFETVLIPIGDGMSLSVKLRD